MAPCLIIKVLCELVGWVETRHIKKAFTGVLSLTSKNLANSDDIVRAQDNVDAPGCEFISRPVFVYVFQAVTCRYGLWFICVCCLEICARMGRKYIFISAWAVSVVRSSISGNARAFRRGTGNGRTHAFFMP